MVSKMACSILSIASFTLCFLPHRWLADVNGIPMRWLMLCITSGPVLVHLHDFVFDDEFLDDFRVIRPWMTLPFVALVCNIHAMQTRLVLTATTLIVARANILVAISSSICCLSGPLDRSGTIVIAALLIDRAFARWRLPLTVMWMRQLVEFYVFFSIVVATGETRGSPEK
tara:strand:+ start:2843 stop:3355 length:513 start_codon:yes stop_codon:yes gene_type:complete